ncbi:sigma factor-like helix-turn-helix DNA-binding protein [Kitasatospora sp. NPDC101183]|uniref:sigma factor-like helix-turn-helix DNA-binding protein n=1 Tax=Kitasatospora sp. NPDC101183 TaxID=3364100 RepID=UPI0038139F46
MTTPPTPHPTPKRRPRERELAHLLRKLTPREAQTLAHLSAGHDLDHIAATLGVTPTTARSYLHRAMRKLGAPTEAAAIALTRDAGRADAEAVADEAARISTTAGGPTPEPRGGRAATRPGAAPADGMANQPGTAAAHPDASPAGPLSARNDRPSANARDTSANPASTWADRAHEQHGGQAVPGRNGSSAEAAAAAAAADELRRPTAPQAADEASRNSTVAKKPGDTAGRPRGGRAATRPGDPAAKARPDATPANGPAGRRGDEASHAAPAGPLPTHNTSPGAEVGDTAHVPHGAWAKARGGNSLDAGAPQRGDGSEQTRGSQPADASSARRGAVSADTAPQSADTGSPRHGDASAALTQNQREAGAKAQGHQAATTREGGAGQHDGLSDGVPDTASTRGRRADSPAAAPDTAAAKRGDEKPAVEKLNGSRSAREAAAAESGRKEARGRRANGGDAKQAAKKPDVGRRLGGRTTTAGEGVVGRAPARASEGATDATRERRGQAGGRPSAAQGLSDRPSEIASAAAGHAETEPPGGRAARGKPAAAARGERAASSRAKPTSRKPGAEEGSEVAAAVRGTSGALRERGGGEPAAAQEVHVVGTGGFDLLYEGAHTRLVQQVFLLTACRHRAVHCVRLAFGEARRGWEWVGVSGDPEGWVRARASELALSPWHRGGPRRAHVWSWPRRRIRVRPADETQAVLPDHDRLTDRDRALLKALKRLSRPQRRALVLHDGLGLPAEAVAREVESTRAAAEARVWSAREALAGWVPDLVGPDPGAPGFADGLSGLLHRAAVRGCPQPHRAAVPVLRARHRLWTASRTGAAALLTVAVGGATLATLAGMRPAVLMRPPDPPAPSMCVAAPGAEVEEPGVPVLPGGEPIGVRSLWCSPAPGLEAVVVEPTAKAQAGRWGTAPQVGRGAPPPAAGPAACPLLVARPCTHGPSGR